jgi:hypothetical protein
MAKVVAYRCSRKQIVPRFNEAGHVVVARVLGIGVRRVYIDDADHGRLEIRRLARRQSAVTIDACERRALIGLAGPTAENHFCGGVKNIERAWQTIWKTDYERAMGCLEGALLLRGDGEGALTTFSPEELTAALDWGLRQAAKLVAAHWSAIERVAKALLERRLLEQTTIDALIAPTRASRHIDCRLSAPCG